MKRTKLEISSRNWRIFDFLILHWKLSRKLSRKLKLVISTTHSNYIPITDIIMWGHFFFKKLPRLSTYGLSTYGSEFSNWWLDEFWKISEFSKFNLVIFTDRVVITAVRTCWTFSNPYWQVMENLSRILFWNFHFPDRHSGRFTGKPIH